MNTFLPFADFRRSAQCLDRARLGKQRVEVLQLLRGSWPHHPASKMWRGYQGALALYGIEVCTEWINRGYNDTTLDKIASYLAPSTMPPWFGDEAFHLAHQSNLTRKDPAHYGKYWSTPAGLPYIWPRGVE